MENYILLVDETLFFKVKEETSEKEVCLAEVVIQDVRNKKWDSTICF